MERCRILAHLLPSFLLPSLLLPSLFLVPVALPAAAQNWQQNDQIFNPSGIPSLPFSQPRFADLDADGDLDLILGSSEDTPLYYRNTGTPTDPAFSAGPDIFAPVGALDAEVGVCVDLDGDLDLISSPADSTGWCCFENTGGADRARLRQSTRPTSPASRPARIRCRRSPIWTAIEDLDLLVGLSESGGS